MSVILLVEIAGKSHPLPLSHRPILLGRSKRCNVRFSDQLISSKHCEILINEDGRVVINDLNSTNGTFVNGVKVMASHLFIGDTLSLGNISLKIDTSKLTPMERQKLTDVGLKTHHKFVDLNNKEPKRSKLDRDFTRMNVSGQEAEEEQLKGTYIIETGAYNLSRHREKRRKSKKSNQVNKLKQKDNIPQLKINRPKIAPRDKTGFFKKLLKSFKKNG